MPSRDATQSNPPARHRTARCVACRTARLRDSSSDASPSNRLSDRRGGESCSAIGCISARSSASPARSRHFSRTRARNLHRREYCVALRAHRAVGGAGWLSSGPAGTVAPDLPKARSGRRRMSSSGGRVGLPSVAAVTPPRRPRPRWAAERAAGHLLDDRLDSGCSRASSAMASCAGRKGK